MKPRLRKVGDLWECSHPIGFKAVSRWPNIAHALCLIKWYDHYRNYGKWIG